jgi:hypothetical protein
MTTCFRRLAAAGAAIAVLVSAPAALADDRYVDGSAGFGHDSNAPCLDPAHPCLTIAAALAQASAGDTVRVGGGNTYAGQLMLPGGVSLVESDFDGPGFLTNGEAVVDGGAAVALTVQDGSQRTVKGLTLRGGDGAGFTVIVAGSALIRKNRFDDTGPGVQAHLVTQSGSPSIAENEFVGANDGTPRAAILALQDTPNIEANTFSAFAYAIYLQALPGSTGVAHVRDNRIGGIHAPPGYNGGGIIVRDMSAAIVGNLIEADAAPGVVTGITVADSGDVSLRRNRIFDFPVAGVSLNSTNGQISLSGDVIAQNNRGIEASFASGGLSIENATITGSDPAASEIALDATQLVLDSSTIGSPGIVSSASSCTISHSNLEPGGSPPASADCGPAAFSTSFAPGFVDPAARDYHLQPSSPLIDLGNPAAPPAGSIDPDGDARAVDGDADCAAQRDIGADEYTPPTPDCSPPAPKPTDDGTAPEGGTVPEGGPTTDTVSPVVSGLSVTNRVFRIGRRAGAVSARLPRGTSFRFGLSEAARATFTIERRTTGRLVAGRCVRGTLQNRGRRGCLRYGPALRFARDAAPGANQLRFSGRVRLGERTRTLRAGRYRLTLRAIDGAGNPSLSRRVAFRVAKAGSGKASDALHR